MKLSLRAICVCIALAPGVASAQQSWNAVGSSDMSWMVFKLYNITLLTDNGSYSPKVLPQALEISYYRNIDKEDLVKATDGQWENLGISKAQRNEWLPELLSLWPDIKKKDTLRFEVDTSGSNMFLYNGEPIGGIQSPGFSQAFLDIWLSTKTSRPALRKRLINGQSGNV
ncbi:chalcone isomerase family protein [Granulosicoccus antarcticus]|uniref:Chalcone isomerase domain-containing protein n=1 Tax=Granulosicoccus antarcticus IMCC3135 TaxID=1192854 RepID=A0A2Z2NQU5_9GAMM|nr:chalcone isomerase family protein [Granulosicoccus antarcticus]ASJ73782.1 hypothetical protein IMCC3135_18515 [Granulosicoccus antarcticus IMCC3135]